MRRRHANGEIAEAVRQIRLMPDPDYEGLWDSIVVDPTVKDRLLRGAALSLRLRTDLPFETTALHGLILLEGPPGTGKTTLCSWSSESTFENHRGWPIPIRRNRPTRTNERRAWRESESSHPTPC